MSDLTPFAAAVAALPASAHERLPHAELAGRTIVVAGASGFVGQWVLGAVAHLNERGDHPPIRVRAWSRGGGRAVGDWLRWEAVDVRHPPSLLGVDGLLHAAAPSTATPPGEDAPRRDLIVEGTRALCLAARDAGVPRLLLASSGAVYAPQTAPLSESAPLDPAPADPYAAARGEAEGVMTTALRDSAVQGCVARLFTVYGAGYRRHEHLAHVSLLRDAVRGGPIVLQGDGTPVRSYLFGADLAVWLLRLLVEGNGVINVGGDEPVTLRRFAEVVAAAAGLPDQRIVLGPGGAPVRRPYYVPDVHRAARDHALHPWTPLAAGLGRTLREMAA